MRRLLPLLGLLAAAASAPAQVFVGSDNFTSGSDAAWGTFYRIAGDQSNNGQLTFTNARLDFSKAAGAGSYYLRWDGNPGVSNSNRTAASYTTSWVADVTVTSLFTPAASEYAIMGLQIVGNNLQYAEMMLGINTGGSPYIRYEGTGITAGSVVTADSTDVHLRFSWDAGNQLLVGSYSFDGSDYTTLNTFNPGTQWSADAATSGFLFDVLGGSDAALAISSGTLYADNFSLTAVPEPSTYAAFAGLGALGLALWRRRQAQKSA